MVIMVQKKGIRFPQSGWHIHRVILHLCIPGSLRRWSAIPEDSVFGYVTKFPIIYTLPRLDFHLFKYRRWKFLAQRSTYIPKGVSSRIDPTVYAYAHIHAWSILFPLKIASLNGHFTVSQVDPGNTIGIDIWMDVYIRGHASLYVVYLRMVKGYANLLLPFTPMEWRLWWIDLMWCL